MENIRLDDVKVEEAKEKHFTTELLDLEEAPQYQTAKTDQEINHETLLNLPAKDYETTKLLEESAETKTGKLNP